MVFLSGSSIMVSPAIDCSDYVSSSDFTDLGVLWETLNLHHGHSLGGSLIQRRKPLLRTLDPMEERTISRRTLRCSPYFFIFTRCWHPPEDFKNFQDLMRRVTTSLGVQAELVPKNPHTLLDYFTVPRRVAISINEVFLEPAKNLWQTSASIRPMAKWVDSWNRVAQ